MWKARPGVQAGGRTGLTALVVAVLFLAALFISPLVGAVPAYATAPALLYVAGLMMRELIDIDWNDVCEATLAALTALIMPLHVPIANGIAFGFISYVVLKTATGKVRDVHPATWLVALLFVIRYAFFPIGIKAAPSATDGFDLSLRRQRTCAGGVVSGHGLRQSRRLASDQPAGRQGCCLPGLNSSIHSPSIPAHGVRLAPERHPARPGACNATGEIVIARPSSPTDCRIARRARWPAFPFRSWTWLPIVQAATRPTPSATPSRSRSRPNDWATTASGWRNTTTSTAWPAAPRRCWIGHVAAHTKTLRVASGGVMLPNHAPLIIAEQFGTLETLYPGRIDLGLGRAPGSDGATQHALRRAQAQRPGIPRAG